MKSGAALLGGLAGACALTVTHEILRHTVPHPPRMDALGERGLRKLLAALGMPAPGGQALFETVLAGDIASNAAAYALAGSSKGAAGRGMLLGVAYGLGAVLLPRPLGLGEPPDRKPVYTDLMTVGLYTLGGIVAGAVAERIAD